MPQPLRRWWRRSEPCLAGDGQGEQALAAPGGAMQQDPARRRGAEGGEAGRIAEVLDNLLQLLDCVVSRRNVGERDGPPMLAARRTPAGPSHSEAPPATVRHRV